MSAATRRRTPPYSRVPDNGMADRAQVHADLVRASGVQSPPAPASRPAAVALRTIRVTADACASGPGRHLLPVVRIAADRRVDPPAGLHDVPTQRDVFLLDLAILKLPRQLVVRAVVLRDDHQTRRAAIEPVDDPRPQLAADAAQVRDVMQQRVDERAARMPGGRDARPFQPPC